jgi:hypothetical protein
MVGIVVGLVAAAVGIAIGLGRTETIELVTDPLLALSSIALLLSATAWAVNRDSMRTGHPRARGML